MISDRAMAHAINNAPRRVAERGQDQAAPPPSLSAAAPVAATASPASPPQRALPPCPLIKPEDGGAPA
ncbi:hypothetical protein CQ13_23295 [Bradyrhizobium retamae]|uniref:Uncharacterized protein n=1 Tax=Bradyrhizobium retamae TaxID=1300035 RepID=A0A0R3N837_9BRAD|nr:hypothetical protein CQ13_23295 [Bradyrhizobium retamae]